MSYSCVTVPSLRRAIDAIVRGVQSGAISEATLNAATERVAAFAARFARPPLAVLDLAVLDSERHRAVVERVLGAGAAT